MKNERNKHKSNEKEGLYLGVYSALKGEKDEKDEKGLRGEEHNGLILTTME